MSFLDALSGGLTAATNAVSATEAAKRAATQANQKNFLDAAMLLKQQRDDEIERQLKGAQAGYYNAHAQSILNPPKMDIDPNDVTAAMNGDDAAAGRVLAKNPSLTSIIRGPKTPQIVPPGSGVLQPDGTYAVPVPKEESLASQLAKQNAADKKEQRLSSAEAWWNDPNAGAAVNAQAGTMFKAMRAQHPSADPRELMAAVKDAIATSAGLAHTQAVTAGAQARANSGVQLGIDPATGKFGVVNKGATPAPSAGTAPNAAASAKRALPSTVDTQLYESNPKYKAWVDAKLGSVP